MAYLSAPRETNDSEPHDSQRPPALGAFPRSRGLSSTAAEIFPEQRSTHS